jgi:hypothetical protein
MPNLDDYLKEIFGDAVASAGEEFKNLIKEAKSDSSEFINNQGKALEKYVIAFASGDITKEEFESLVRGQASLYKIEGHRLSVKVNARAEALSNNITEIVIEGMLKMI